MYRRVVMLNFLYFITLLNKVRTIAIAKYYLACKKIIIVYLIMAGLNKDTGFRGAFSYLNNNSIYVIVKGPNTELRMQAVAVAVARLYFTDNNGNPVQVPNG